MTSNTIYIAPAGGLSLSGTYIITGTNVMIFVPSGSININPTGTGAVTLSPMTTGPYAGVTIFQDRSDPNPDTLVGNGNLNITGSIYAPAAIVNATGNGLHGCLRFPDHRAIPDDAGDCHSGFRPSATPPGPAGTLRNFGLVQ